MDGIEMSDDKKPSREALLRYSTLVLEYVGNLDPDWKNRIQITREERGYDDLQVLGSYVAGVLQFGNHLVFIDHPAFLPKK